MSGDLRTEKECENCGYTVDVAYCSKCGQKNVETRQSFWHLITHFAEDFTHYDSAFWKTIKYLLLKPAKLTKEYLEGYRQRYVAPVKLYIFISFITFFIPSLYPEFEIHPNEFQNSEHHTEEVVIHKKVTLEEKINTKQNVGFETATINSTEFIVETPMTYSSIKEMDSIEKIKPDHLRLSKSDYILGKKILKLYEHNTPEQVGEKLKESIKHNFPKALFIYMPFFAFILWLFHGKKRWYFFDHGIFTLHYFSFLLLTSFIMITLSRFISPLGAVFEEIVVPIIIGLVTLWTVYYFFRSHRKMYHEKWIINFTKCLMMLIINFISVLYLTLIFIKIAFYSLH